MTDAARGRARAPGRAFALGCARRARLWLAVSALGVAAACEKAREPGGGAAAEALASRVSAVWDAAFVLERAPPGARVGAAPDERPRVRGTLTLLQSAGGARSALLRGPATHTGVYDIDFRPLGFAPKAGGPVPALVASVTAPDSIVLVLPAGVEDGVLLLDGTATGDSVTGTWSYGGRSAAGWGGTFVLHPHAQAAH